MLDTFNIPGGDKGIIQVYDTPGGTFVWTPPRGKKMVTMIMQMPGYGGGGGAGGAAGTSLLGGGGGGAGGMVCVATMPTALVPQQGFTFVVGVGGKGGAGGSSANGSAATDPTVFTSINIRSKTNGTLVQAWSSGGSGGNGGTTTAGGTRGTAFAAVNSNMHPYFMWQSINIGGNSGGAGGNGTTAAANANSTNGGGMGGGGGGGTPVGGATIQAGGNGSNNLGDPYLPLLVSAGATTDGASAYVGGVATRLLGTYGWCSCGGGGGASSIVSSAVGGRGGDGRWGGGGGGGGAGGGLVGGTGGAGGNGGDGFVIVISW